MSTPYPPRDSGTYPYNAGGQPGYPGALSGAATENSGQRAGYSGQQAYVAPGAYPGAPSYMGGAGDYQGFGSYPIDGGLSTQPVRPSTVVAAFWCWIAAMASSSVSLLLILRDGSLWDQLVVVDSAGVPDPATEAEIVRVLQTSVIGLFVVIAALYLFFGLKMLAGRNWARITLTVSGALSALITVTPSSYPTDANHQLSFSTHVPGYVTSAFVVAAIVLMYLSASNKFFAAAKTYQQVKAYQQIQH